MVKQIAGRDILGDVALNFADSPIRETKLHSY